MTRHATPTTSARRPSRPSPRPTRPPPTSQTSPTQRDYVSYTALSTFQQCPLKYHFQYVARVPPAFKASSLVFGGAIHSALEHHWQAVFAGTAPPSLDELLHAYDTSWQQEATLPVRFGKDESPETLRNQAQRMLEAYRDSPLSKLDTELLAVEEEFRGPLLSSGPAFLGRVDLLTRNRNALHITDFKTSRSTWNAAKLQEALPQMLLYAALLQPLARSLDLADIRLQWIVLTKTKAPSVELHSHSPTDQEVQRSQRTAQRVWQAIAAGTCYPSPSSLKCATCPYQQPCQQWEG